MSCTRPAGRRFAVLFAAVMLSLMAWAYLGFEAGRTYERAHPAVSQGHELGG